MAKNLKILILRFSSIGDIVLTTPVMRCLKQQLPDAEIHFCTKQAYTSLVAPNPYVDKVHALGDSIGELLTRLRPEPFDYIIDLHRNLRTQRIKWGLPGVKSYSFDKLNWQKWLYVRTKNPNVMPNVHIVDRYLATVAPLGVTNDGNGLDYFIPPDDEVPLADLPETHRPGYVAFAIGGQHFTKKLPPNRLVELCRKINYPIILLGGKEDREVGEMIERNLGKELIYNGCGTYRLHQSASLIRQAAVVFSHDTGLMHVAAAFRKKVYSIWGNTTPQLGMYPYKTDFVAMQTLGLPCRPCSKIGFDACPQTHFKCMNDMSFEGIKTLDWPTG